MRKSSYFLLMVQLFLLVAWASEVQAQRTPAPQQRAWSQGPLVYGDFRGRPSSAAEGSYLDFRFGVRDVRQSVEGAIIPRQEAYAYMLPYASWMLPGSRNPQRLRYHQLQFDLLELSRRELQRDLDRQQYTVDYLFAQADSTLTRRLYKLDSLSDFGRDTAILSAWNAEVCSLLDSLPAATAPAPLRPAFGAEIGFGMGGRFYRGPLADGFNPGLDFGFNVNVLFQRHMLAFDFNIGMASLRDSVMTNDGPFYLDTPASDLRLLLEYGYRLIDRHRWAFTPFVGGGVHILDQGDDVETFYVAAPTWGAGLMAQYRFALSFTPLNDGSVERYDCDLTGRFMFVRSSFNGILTPQSSGWAFFFQLGFAVGYQSFERVR